MRVNEFIWLDAIVDKLAVKHQVEVEEVEDVFSDTPKFRFVQKGNREGEDVYMALGRTEAGRYLVVLFIYKPSMPAKSTGYALILSARDMVDKERKMYGKN